MLLRVAFVPNCLPSPVASEPPLNPGESPDLNFLPGVFGGKEASRRAELSVRLAFQVVQDLPSLFMAVSIDAEHEQVGQREIVENPADLLPLLHAFPASRVRS